MPNQHLKESPFFLMLGRVAVTNFTKFITPDFRYISDNYPKLKLNVMKDIYHLVTYNIKLAREWMLKSQKPINKPEINIGDLVLVHDHTSKSFMLRFKEDFRVVSIKGNSLEVKKNHGLLSTFHMTDVRKMTMAEKVEELLPDFQKFGRKGKLCMNPDLFKNLGWTLDHDPPNLMEFRDNMDNNSTCTQDSVNNTIKVSHTQILH